MIVTVATTIVRKAENSKRTMSENPERSLPNCSTELKGEKSCNKAMIERLTYLEDSDLECTCHLSMKNITE